MKKTADVVMIEDSPTEAAIMLSLLEGEPGVRMHLATTGLMGLRLIEQVRPQAVLLDINLPDMSGLDVLDQARALDRAVPVVMVTGQSKVDTVVDCMRRGAFDYVTKPFGAERMRVTLRNAIERHRLETLVDSYREPYENGFLGMIGTSPLMRAVYRIIECAGPSGGAVFITGESGTGKELCAEAIHRTSPRTAKPFIALNCAALPHDLAESELFGHVRGAFTGATQDRAGAVELADGGTLFLDEVGEMPPELQAKLLRFVQTGTYRRVGDGRLRKSDVRLVSATNRDPRAMIAAGSLREDLYYRLHVIPVHMPPLRTRGEDDILALANHLLARISAEEGKDFTGLAPEAAAWITRHAWPGNVRELENAIRLAVVMNAGPRLEAAMLAASQPEAGTAEAPRIPLRAGMRPLAEIERDAIEAAVAACGGNVSAAARLLGINPSTIHRKRRSWAEAGSDSPAAVSAA